MNSLNIIGNISTNVEIRYTPSGKAVTTFNIAVSNPFKRDKTSFIPVEVWGKIAELTAEYCQKGSKIGINGHIEVDQWEKDGERKSKTKVVASNVEFLTPKGSGDDNTQSNTNTAGSRQNSGNSTYTRVDDDPFANDGKTINIQDDDLPF